MRFRLMLSSMSVDVRFLGNISETTKASNFKMQNTIAIDSLYIFTGNDVTHQLLPVGHKSHKRVHFASSSGRDFSVMVHPMLKKFTVLETVVQGLHFLLCNLLDIFAPLPRKMGAQLNLPSFTRYVDG